MAGVSATIRNTSAVAGQSFAFVDTQDSNTAVVFNESLAAAKVGQLTTRTSTSAGTLTMVAGHGITTGSRIDLYWAGGRRYGILVGTVSTNSVPFTVGAGDDLPTNLTAITAMNPTQVLATITGNNIVGIHAACDNALDFAQVVFTDSNPTDLYRIAIDPAVDAFQWYTDSGLAISGTPFSGTTVVKLYLSHGDSTGARVVRGVVQYN